MHNFNIKSKILFLFSFILAFVLNLDTRAENANKQFPVLAEGKKVNNKIALPKVSSYKIVNKANKANNYNSKEKQKDANINRINLAPSPNLKAVNSLAIVVGEEKNDLSKQDSARANSSENISNSLKNLISVALANNNALKQKEELVSSQNWQRDAKVSAMMPKISLEYQSSDNSYKKSSANNIDKFTTNENTRQILLRQNLFEGFAGLNRLSAESSRLEIAKYDFKAQQQSLIVGVVKSYLNFLRLNELLKNAKQELLVYQQHLENSRQKLSKYEITKSDFLQVEVSLNNAIIKQERINQQIFQEKYRLRQMLNQQQDTYLALENREEIANFIENKLSSFETEVAKISQDIELHIKSSPRIKQSKTEVSLKKSLRNIAKSNFMPRVDFDASLAKNQYDTQANAQQNYNQNERSINIKVSLPVFDSWQDKYNLNSTNADYRAVMAKYREDSLGVLSAIQSEIARFNINRKLLIASKRNYQVASKIYDNAFIEFSNGLKDNFELLYFINNLYSKSDELINVNTDLAIGFYNILELLGEANIDQL